MKTRGNRLRTAMGEAAGVVVDQLIEPWQRRASKQTSRSLARWFCEPLEQRLLFTWIGATSGGTNDAAHNYNNPANWAGGVIDDSFNGVNFTADTILYFSASRTAGSGGLNLNYAGGHTLFFESAGAGTTPQFNFDGQSVTLGTIDVIGPGDNYVDSSPSYPSDVNDTIVLAVAPCIP